MNAKKLLLLVLTILLPFANNLSASNDFSFAQEYGDTNTTSSLLSETSQELMQAYDLLEMLKKRSDEIAHNDSLIKKDMGARLPRNIDQIRNRLVKKQLLDVLSATPFSNPEKHLNDCKAAILALESYMAELKQAQGATTTTESLVHTPAPASKTEKEIAHQYDITDEAPTVEKASTVVPTSLSTPTQTPTPIEKSTPLPTTPSTTTPAVTTTQPWPTSPPIPLTPMPTANPLPATTTPTLPAVPPVNAPTISMPTASAPAQEKPTATIPLSPTPPTDSTPTAAPISPTITGMTPRPAVPLPTPVLQAEPAPASPAKITAPMPPALPVPPINIAAPTK